MPTAIRKIQKVLHEPETGQYDDRMDKIMSRPRCGTHNSYNETEAKSPSPLGKRYVLWGPKWDHTAITYRFVNFTKDVDESTQRTTIRLLLPITISPAPSSAPTADIHIRFISLGDNETVFAATSMIADGTSLWSGLVNITFNDDYRWSDDRLFRYTAIHEIGHALGLSHSKVEDAIMFPYYDGMIHPLHPDDEAAVHVLYGWKVPRWSKIDSNSNIKTITQVSSNSTTPAAQDGLYQMRSSGQVMFHNPSGSWVSVDNNKDTVQIAGSSGNLFQRHYDGSVYQYTGTGSNWVTIAYASDNNLDIVSAAGSIYLRRKDGWVARWSGSGTTWNTIEQPAMSRQIAVTDQKTLWNLLNTGDVVRSEWPYNGNGWVIVDQNPSNVAIAVGGEEFYKLQTDGKIVWLDMDALLWRTIEDANSGNIYASGQYLFSAHKDGSIWRYTGTPGIWEQLDNVKNSASVIGDRRGQVWEMLSTGDVLKLVS
ncbi:hypothetical protein BCR34DRAFT_595411 [Clohesyomyces aquaticus]|uniref:Peptidase metallopeptidase domain-containing protein n=1 Tax=Clohesyomyces aquaticus TaxID=1231657 RepID=A0A1Y2ABQ1_9PLEO|nr:hypothetical protein BCR34DRAFT_595411 [Clohesyomyces aquaticus]